MKQYFIRLALCCLLLGATTAVHAQFSGSGSGTSGDPYIITTPQQLDEVRSNLAANYKLANDIDLADYLSSTGAGYNAGAGWNPIGDNYTYSFTGAFDGDGHIIKNLKINRPSTNFIGLFGCADGAALIKNLGVENTDIVGSQFTGGVVGWNSSGGTVQNCYHTGSVNSGSTSVGGVVGYNVSGSTVQNCYNAGDIVSSDNTVGGVVGQNSGSAVSNCYNSGTVSGNGTSVGGVVGFNGITGTVTNCFYDNTVNPALPGIGSDANSGNTATGLPTAQMKQQATFTTTPADWDFDNTWTMQENVTYPLFKWQNPPFMHGLIFDAATEEFHLNIANDYDPTNPANTLYTEQSGAWSWNGTTHTLSLNGFNWTTPDAMALIIADSSNPLGSSNLTLTINLTGNNTFESGSDSGGNMSIGILSLISNVTIQGTGTLNAVAGNASPVMFSFGITAGMGTLPIKAITVNGGTLNASSGEATGVSCALSADLTVSGGSVTATGGQIQGAGTSYGIYSTDMNGGIAQPLTFSGGTVTASGYTSAIVSYSVANGAPDARYTGPAITSSPYTYWTNSASTGNPGGSGTSVPPGAAYSYSTSDKFVKIETLPSVPFCGGTGTTTDPYIICNAEQLDSVRYFLSSSFKLANDIDLSGYLSLTGAGYDGGAGWMPIGDGINPFRGTFDGDGHKITGLTITRSTDDNVGLFGKTNGTTISNLGLENVNIAVTPNTGTGASTGAVVGYNSGAVTNCYVTGSVSGGGASAVAGGVVGLNYSSVTNCRNAAAVIGFNTAGGVVGSNVGTVSNCQNSGTVSVSSSYSGGIAGRNDAAIQNCYNTGAVNCKDGISGGIVGNEGSGSTVQNCYNTGNITAGAGAGGVIGQNDGSVSYCFYDKDICGNIGGINGADQTGQAEGKTTAQMKTQATFDNPTANWDFVNIWIMQENVTYPLFKWQNPPFQYGLIFDAGSGATGGKFYLDENNSNAIAGNPEYTPTTGTATWDGTNKILTLNGFNWETSAYISLFIIGGDLTLNLAAGSTNTITSTYNDNGATYGFYCHNGNLTISGSGTLNATSGNSIDELSYGIFGVGSITIDGGNINATSGEAPTSKGIISASYLTVNGGTVTATGNSQAINASPITLPSAYTYWTNTTADDPLGAGVTYPADAAFANSSTYKFVKIKTLNTAYGLIFDVSNKKFYLDINNNRAFDDGTDIEYTDQSDKWTFSNDTLYLNNFVWETPAPIALTITNGDLTLNIEGVNTFTSASVAASSLSAGINPQNNLVITGSGTLNAKSGNGIQSVFGIGADLNLTVNSGTVNAVGGDASNDSYGIYVNGIFAVNGGAVTSVSGNSTTNSSYGITAGTVNLNGGAVAATASTAGSYGYGIVIKNSDGAFNIAGGAVAATGNSQAIYLISGSTLTTPAAYTYWTSTTAADPGGAGTQVPPNAAFANDNSYKFVKIETINIADYGLIFDKTTQKFYLDNGLNTEYTDQSANWSFSDDTLYLNNFVWTTPAQRALTIINGNLNIDIEGANSFVSTHNGASTIHSAGIWADNSSLTVSGGGALNATAGNASSSFTSCGIYCSLFTLNGGSVTASGGAADWSMGIVTSSNVSITGGALITNGAASYNASEGINCNGMSITGGTVTASGDTGIGSYGIFNAAELTITGGAVTVQGNSQAIFTSLSITLPAAYTYWQNTANAAPSDSITFPGGAAFANSSSLKFAKIKALNAADYGLLFNVSDGKFYVNADGSGTVNANNFPYLDQSTKWSFSGNTLYLNNFVWTTPAKIALTITGGDLNIDVAGDNQLSSTYNGASISLGIFDLSNLVVSGSGALDITGGNSSNSSSYGIQIIQTLTLNGGTVNATGGAALMNSFGIESNNGNIIINGGTINATGSAASESYGISSANSIEITGGTVNATGGTASETGGDSYGIRSAANTTITGGTINAAGGAADDSYGIYPYEDLTITGGAVTAQGNSQAIVLNGAFTLPNVYTYWTNTAASDPLGTGIIYPAGAAFDNTADTYKFVKIKTINPADYGLIFDKTTQKFYYNIDGTNTFTANDFEYTEQADKWTFSNDTLYLNGFVWETPATVAFTIADGSGTLNINVEGVNTFASTFSGTEVTAGMSSNPALFFSGGGSLNVTGGNSTNGSLGFIGTGFTLNSGTITFTGGATTVGSSIGVNHGGFITVNGGTLNAIGGTAGTSGSYGIAGLGGAAPVTLNGGVINASGGAYGISDTMAAFSINGGTVTATGGTRAMALGALYAPPAYTYWTNTDTSDPLGAGITYPTVNTPFANSNTYKFVKIESLPYADLEITKTANDPTPNVGDNITFTINVTNNGKDDATNVEVTDLLPSGLTYISSTATAGSYNNTTGIWNISVIANGDNITLNIIAKVTSANQFTNTATVTSDLLDIDLTNNTASATVTPRVLYPTLTLSASPADSTTYGNSVTLTATLSGGYNPTGMIEFVVNSSIVNIATVSGNGEYTYTLSTPNAGTYEFFATYDADVNNAAAPSNRISDYLVNKADQTGFAFTDANPVNKTYGDASFSVSAAGGQSAGDVTYTVTTNPDVISVNSTSGEVTILKAGTAVITATKAANGNYNETTATVTINVNPKGITVTANGGNSTYGDNPTNQGISCADLVNGETISVLTGLSNSFGITNTTAAGTYTLTVEGTLTNANYTVTATNDGTWIVNPRPLTITATDETINYGQTPALNYTITSGNLVNGDMLSGSLAVDNLNVGQHAITQDTLSAGNNYDITFVQGTLTVLSVDVAITEIDIDGKSAVQGDNLDYSADVECNEDAVIVTVSADPNATVIIDGVAENPHSVSLPNYGDNVIYITVTAQNGNSQTYTLTLNKPIPFDQIVIMRWNNTLTVINNPANNGGYTFTSYKWYRNGQEISTDQSISAGANGEQLDPSDVYYVEVTADGVSGIIRSCESNVTLQNINVTVYPNPVSKGNMLYIQIDAGAEMLKDAVVEIYSEAGILVRQMKIQGTLTPINISYASGNYVFFVRGKDGFRKIVKVVVK